MTGGHNVAGGYDELTAPAISAELNPSVNDLMDGGSGDDSMAGDNAIIWRRGDDLSPRFRLLTADNIYTTGPDFPDQTITTNVGGVAQSDPDDAIGRITRMDAINNKSVTEASLRQAEEKLRNLKRVLSKVGTKEFGICIKCAKPIPEARILYRPESLTCVNCAK